MADDSDGGMERISLRMSGDLIDILDDRSAMYGYPNRSEFIRDAVRKLLGFDSPDYLPPMIQNDHADEITETYLRFDHRNVGYVLDGQEDITLRWEFERDLSAGDLVALKTPNGNVFAIAEVEQIHPQVIKNVVSDCLEFDGQHYPHDDPQDILNRLNDLYPDAQLNPNSVVTVIHFDVQIPTVPDGDVDESC